MQYVKKFLSASACNRFAKAVELPLNQKIAVVEKPSAKGLVTFINELHQKKVTLVRHLSPLGWEHINLTGDLYLESGSKHFSG